MTHPYTLAQVTTAMRRTEKIINWHNAKYHFNMETAKPAHQKEYNMCLKMWDTFKAVRDKLKAEA